MNQRSRDSVLELLSYLLNRQTEMENEILMLHRIRIGSSEIDVKRMNLIKELLLVLDQTESKEERHSLIDQALGTIDLESGIAELRTSLARLETNHDTLAAHVVTLRERLKDLSVLDW